MSQISTRSN